MKGKLFGYLINLNVILEVWVELKLHKLHKLLKLPMKGRVFWLFWNHELVIQCNTMYV